MAWILAADIGGTKTNLALVNSTNPRQLHHFAHFYNHGTTLEAIVSTYLKQLLVDSKPTIASFAIAGPVLNGRVEATNLPWVIDAKRLEQEMSLQKVYLLNDLEAGAWSIEVLENLVPLQQGVEQKGNRALISPGTGLGEAGLYWDGVRYHPFATEGGHVDFAAITKVQLELTKYLTDRFGHASYERLLSGPGIHNLFLFLKDVKGYEQEEELKLQLQKAQDPVAVISQFGVENRSEICARSLDLFLEILAQEAGNVALKFLARGGIYLGGGILPKIFHKLEPQPFCQSFSSKGRFEKYLTQIPIYLITDETANLKGAACAAINKL